MPDSFPGLEQRRLTSGHNAHVCRYWSLFSPIQAPSRRLQVHVFKPPLLLCSHDNRCPRRFCHTHYLLVNCHLISPTFALGRFLILATSILATVCNYIQSCMTGASMTILSFLKDSSLLNGCLSLNPWIRLLAGLVTLVVVIFFYPTQSALIVFPKDNCFWKPQRRRDLICDRF
jgi:hypothetical protein